MKSVHEMFNPETHPVANENLNSMNRRYSFGSGAGGAGGGANSGQIVNNLSATDYFDTFRKEFRIARDYLGIIHEEHRARHYVKRRSMIEHRIS